MTGHKLLSVEEEVVPLAPPNGEAGRIDRIRHREAIRAFGYDIHAGTVVHFDSWKARCECGWVEGAETERMARARFDLHTEREAVG